MGEKTKKNKEKQKDEISEINLQINKKVEEWREKRGGIPCYSLLIYPRSIDFSLVNDVYDDLKANYSKADGKLDVIVHCSGGDIDQAYNLAGLFRMYGESHLEFIVPRWAKSAATMLVCAGDRILMSPVAELGPLDPQITEMNPLEGRLERFSPLHIHATMKLIREEYSNGNEKLAGGLLERLQFPLTLGRYRSFLNVGKEYLSKLLTSRMIPDNCELVESIAKQITTGYADHAYCLGVQEARELGLIVEEMSDKQESNAWDLFRLWEQRSIAEKTKREEEVKERLKNLPQEILDSLPEILEQINREE